MAHPYYPQDLVIPNYIPNTWTMAGLFAVFGSAVGAVAVLTWTLSGLLPKKPLSSLERTLMTWWAVTGTIHFVLEGAFVVMPEFVADSTHNFFSDAWKEYALSDSRYVTRDSFIVSVEAVTAFVEGPLCFYIVYAIGARLPISHLLQLLVAFGELYGDVLYFGTAFLEGFPHSNPRPMYFWGYFVGLNSIWIVVPGLIAFRSATYLVQACAVRQQAVVGKKPKSK